MAENSVRLVSDNAKVRSITNGQKQYETSHIPALLLFLLLFFKFSYSANKILIHGLQLWGLMTHHFARRDPACKMVKFGNKYGSIH